MSKDRVIIPSIRFYNQDIVDLYNNTWSWIEKYWVVNKDNPRIPSAYLSNPEQKSFNYFYSLLSSFFLVYSSEKYPAENIADFFYGKQEDDGAIYSDYDTVTGERILLNPDDPVGVCIPIFPWVEHNFYVNTGSKKRLKEVMPKLDKFYKWLKSRYMDETGLFKVTSMNYITGNIDRSAAAYPVEFNAAMAFYCYKSAQIGEILKDKEVRLYYKKQYIALKNRLNRMMWSDDFYYDLDENGQIVPGSENIGAYFTLLANVCDEDRSAVMISHLKDPRMFGTENPFPTIPVKNKKFSKDGNGYYGGVSSVLTFIVIKAIDSQRNYSFAKECTLKHAFCILDSEMLDDKKIPSDVWEVYKPNDEGPSLIFNSPKHNSYNLPRRKFLPAVGLITITLFIENIIGFNVNMSKKTVIWILEDFDQVGIHNYYLKKNYISMECVKTEERWEIKLDSEKLYYLVIVIISKNLVKNLAFPAGKCSLIPDKFASDDISIEEILEKYL